MTTIVLADDHPLVRQGLRAVLDTTDDIEVVAEADDGREAVRLCVEQHPDVVLMDLQMPGLHGIDATREVCRVAPDTAVLVLTHDDDTVFGPSPRVRPATCSRARTAPTSWPRCGRRRPGRRSSARRWRSGCRAGSRARRRRPRRRSRS